jgi:hypothetical protein
VDLLLLAPLRHLLRRLGYCVCYERIIPLVELGVVGVEVR